MWAQIASALLGLWLMAAPSVLGYGDPARTVDQVVGPLIFAMALIAYSEVTRPVRWVNFPLGVWLICAPWALGYAGTTTWLHSMIVGAAIAVLAGFGGRSKARIGGGWSALWQPGTSGDPAADGNHS